MIFSQTSEYLTGAVRWLRDSEKIEFASTAYLAPNNIITTTFNLIEQDGNNLQIRLNLTAAFGMSEGTWPPDGQEFAFTYGNAPPKGSGLYILDLNTGERRQILSHFYLGLPPHINVWEWGVDGASE